MADAAASERRVPVRKFSGGDVVEAEDRVAVEEPLEIVIGWPAETEDSIAETRNIAVTMRTPGNDAELALGFLFTEGLIPSVDAVVDVRAEPNLNRVTVILREVAESSAAALERNFYMTSSCGVCGKASIDAIRTHAQFSAAGAELRITAESLVSLPQRLTEYQAVFRGTGSIHAAALFDAQGLRPEVFEDVGRHNAVDKLVGAMLRAGQLPLHRAGLLVSGRASFELVQKARMAGCAILASVGAPSSLAIDLAWDSDMTLIGFLRDGRFNVYAGPARVDS
jgi:FdhD protein